MRKIILFVTMIFYSNIALSEYGFNLTRGVSSVSRDIYSLHMFVFWVCVVIAIVVFGFMFYSIIKHRKSQGAIASNFHDNTTVELVWTAIPLIILVIMAIPASRF